MEIVVRVENCILCLWLLDQGKASIGSGRPREIVPLLSLRCHSRRRLAEWMQSMRGHRFVREYELGPKSITYKSSLPPPSHRCRHWLTKSSLACIVGCMPKVVGAETAAAWARLETEQVLRVPRSRGSWQGSYWLMPNARGDDDKSGSGC